MATSTIPKILSEEMKASKRYWDLNKKCIFCEVIKKEREGSRLILENPSLVVLAPYASVNPMEFWIVPKKHAASILSLSNAEIKALAETMKTSLNALKHLVNDPPYNYGFHLAMNKAADKFYHWHLEVYPKLATWAGFEKSTGMYINTVTPETAAESMRTAISS